MRACPPPVINMNRRASRALCHALLFRDHLLIVFVALPLNPHPFDAPAATYAAEAVAKLPERRRVGYALEADKLVGRNLLPSSAATLEANQLARSEIREFGISYRSHLSATARVPQLNAPRGRARPGGRVREKDVSSFENATQNNGA